MGACCSKCGVYTTNNKPESRDTTHTGDTPKLSRLQQKDSFSNGKVHTNGNGLAGKGGERDSGLATPTTGDTCHR